MRAHHLLTALLALLATLCVPLLTKDTPMPRMIHPLGAVDPIQRPLPTPPLPPRQPHDTNWGAAMDLALTFLPKAEGCRMIAYRDSGGVWTIGVGHTGPDVHAGMTITQQQCDNLLKGDLQEALECLKDTVLVYLTPHQGAALLSFVFNVGVTAFKTSTLLGRLNEGKMEDIPHQLHRWVYDNHKKVHGLVVRRDMEVALWHGTPVNDIHHTLS